MSATTLAMLVVASIPTVQERVESATCFIDVDGYSGSGGAIHTHDPDVYVLTVGHLFDKRGKITCRFFTGSRKEVTVNATLVKRGEPDLALLYIKRSEFTTGMPHRLKLGQYSPRKGDEVISNGFPMKNGPFVFSAKVVGLWNDFMVWDRFPEQGRSGSLICEKRTGDVVGAVSQQPMDGSEWGKGPHIEDIYSFLGLNRPLARVIGPEKGSAPAGFDCPNGMCLPQQQQQQQRFPGIRGIPLNMHRRQHDRMYDELPGWERPGEPIQEGPPPTLEAPEPITPEPVVTEVPNDEIDTLKDSILNLREELKTVTERLALYEGRKPEPLTVEFLRGDGTVQRTEQITDRVLRIPAQRLRTINADDGTHVDTSAALGTLLGISTKTLE